MIFNLRIVANVAPARKKLREILKNINVQKLYMLQSWRLTVEYAHITYIYI